MPERSEATVLCAAKVRGRIFRKISVLYRPPQAMKEYCDELFKQTIISLLLFVFLLLFFLLRKTEFVHLGKAVNSSTPPFDSIPAVRWTS